MNEILLNGISLIELLEKMGQVFETKLEKASTKQVKVDQVIYLTREQVKDKFQITYPTLADWTKQDWLKSYKIKGRVYYKLSEVEEAAQLVPNKKHKKNLE